MVNCLAGCIKDYMSGTIFSSIPDGLESENFSPIIKADIINSGIGITVGNKSYPYRKNNAIIKSIRFGFVDGMEGSIEIIDQEGDAFSLFMDYLLKCPKESEMKRSIISFQLGWTYTKCNNPFAKNNIVYSPIIESRIQKASSSISNGVIRFNIDFATEDKILQNFRENKIFGEETGGKKMKLNDAINQLAAIEPALIVRYARYNESGELIYLPEGHKWSPVTDPKTSWQADNLDRYSVIQKWIEPFTVNNGNGEKGVLLIHSLRRPNEIIILEDPANANDDQEIEKRTLGTFIVNGGNCSGVLEFNPNVDFTAPMPSEGRGGSTDPTSSRNEIKEKENKNNLDNMGSQQTIVVSQQAVSILGKEASKTTNKSQNKHSKANEAIDINFRPISGAELKIVGTTDKRFYTSLMKGKYLAIVVISPFYIQERNNDCGDFLKNSSCHPVFSSKEWTITGVEHSVQEGSFVTTLKVDLLNPPKVRSGKTEC